MLKFCVVEFGVFRVMLEGFKYFILTFLCRWKHSCCVVARSYKCCCAYLVGGIIQFK
jgi:hypothetical protein